jgi:hypothetical protein
MMNSNEELVGVGESDTIILFYIMFIVSRCQASATYT